MKYLKEFPLKTRGYKNREYHSECKLCRSAKLKPLPRFGKFKVSTFKSKSRKEVITKYGEGKSCVLCGEPRIITLDYHHVDPRNKRIEISKAASSDLSPEDVLLELGKCSVICSNCHRVLHSLVWELDRTCSLTLESARVAEMGHRGFVKKATRLGLFSFLEDIHGFSMKAIIKSIENRGFKMGAYR